MIHLAWRWPLLAASLSGGYFFFQNFTIGGLEHLHLAPRGSSLAESYASGAAQPDPMLAMQIPQTTMDSGGEARGWKDNLTVGERLAVWEQSQTALTPESQTTQGLPMSPPIPMPLGFPSINPAGAELPSTTANSTSVAPSAPTVSPPGLPASTSQPIAKASPPAQQNPFSETPSLVGKRIRIASFNAGSLGMAKMDKPHVVASLIKMFRQFDVIAIQEVQSPRDDVLPMLVEQLNTSGRKYDYLIGPRVGRGTTRIQYAFLFDTDALETDRYQLYTVDDPDDLLNFEPLVGWFRCKRVPEHEAFTFSLINLRIDSNMATAEHAILSDLIEVIQKDGRGEDDWIIAGDLAGDRSALHQLDVGRLRFAIQDIPTMVAGDQSLDSIFFSAQATTEYTGRAEAFDFLRKYNLSFEQALEISDHLPIWAEFSVLEGDRPGRIAPVQPVH